MTYRLALCLGQLLKRFGMAAFVFLAMSWQSPSSLHANNIDYSAYNQLLKASIKRGGQGLNRVDYAFLKKQLPKLKTIIAQMQAVRPSKLARNEQFAYWANLYNILTLKVVAQHYPVKSIKDISISPGLFSSGPWGKKLISIEGRMMSLDDIEHQTLRKRFKSPLVHYSVNCASVGCPNLRKQAFSGARLQAQLAQAARDFVNSARGVRVKGHTVTVSKIYKWFAKDFGGSDKNVLAHLWKYARPALKQKLARGGLSLRYQYDWRLNNVR